MVRALLVLFFVLALQGCSGLPANSAPATASACAQSPGSYACQIEEYQRAQ